ncbi:uncharacterized protein FA14DRAFT_159702 [Meira miltonrushii]|uniref:M-phase inducer phosphatase n=1 Tax=Meira miltonrushii TaxID=1280837 RepID=A0A316VJR5_9BASI|nr:uncharacterized protein FA14DRAFT_159702 [Meira miltonrushii]PWN37849.1 hypothetical protein FA14DRAFT_159702 [Meira miltonrushii]
MMERTDVLLVSKHYNTTQINKDDQIQQRNNTNDLLTDIGHSIEHLESNHRIRSNIQSESINSLSPLSSDEQLSAGSSMSLGSSTGQPTSSTMAAATQQNAFFQHHQVAYYTSTASTSTAANTMSKPMKKRSPRRANQEGLGAAMGTMLNSKSPGLAAKMTTTQYMDMSPIPASRISYGEMTNAALLQQTPSKTSQSCQEDEDENLPPGSAMKIDSPLSTQENSTLKVANDKNARRKAGSLGRLFGTELSQHCSTADHEGYKTMPLGGPSNTTKHTSLGCVFGGGMNDTSSMTSRATQNLITPQDMSVSMDSSSLLAMGDYSIEDASPSVQCRIRQQNNSSKQPSPKGQKAKLPKIHLPPGFDEQGSPVVPTARPNLFRRPSKDDSSPLGYGKKFASFTARSGTSAALAMGYNLDTTQGSPRSPASTTRHSTGLVGVGSNDQLNMPGFGASELQGKILPCFSVKDDGLMRITAETLLKVLNGDYDQQMDGFQVIDCRFGYEFEGGHIEGAINLSTMDKVKKHFLQPELGSSTDENCPSSSKRCLPPRSQSGKADVHGNKRKKVLIFHCEFSLKRGPSSALALRQADRALAHDYPNCHFPEVYVLQGGYSGFFTRYSGKACKPNAYIPMDDPQFQQHRSIELNGFRKQFSRHRSFTYGDARQVNSDSNLVMPPPQQPNQRGAHQKVMTSNMIKEEDSSFDQSGGSPSALQASALMARRKGLMRHATASCALGSAPNMITTSRIESSSTTSSSSLGVKPVLTNRMRSVQEGGKEKPAPTCVGDLSFDDSCSIGDDSTTSFDGENGINDSPCAAATASSHSRRLPALAPGPRPPMMSSFSTSAARMPQFRAPRRTASSNSFVPAMSPMER